MARGRIILDGDSYDSDPKPPAKPNNGKPLTLAAAKNGDPGGSGRWYGLSGDPGMLGTSSNTVPGQNGDPGKRGGDAHNATIQVNLLQFAQPLPVSPADPGWLSARGGNGGPGGDASTPGGDGQAGGNGGAGWFLGRGGDGGDGGAGGAGAVGGFGGDGGDGGVITLNYVTSVPVVVRDPAALAGGKGGLGGAGGVGGVGGAGGIGGSSVYGPSPNGVPGHSANHPFNGQFGRTGKPGRFM